MIIIVYVILIPQVLLLYRVCIHVQFLHLHAEKIELRSETNMKFRVEVGDLTTVDYQGLDKEHRKRSPAIHQVNAVCICEVILCRYFLVNRGTL